MPSQSYKNVLCITLITVLILIAYLPASLHLGYVWDDLGIFITNPSLRLASMAWHAIWQPILPESHYFRPLPMATFALQFITFGLSAALTHSINITLLCLNSILVYILANHFLDDFTPQQKMIRATLAALIYGLHPALIESTSWAVGRFDEMATFFILIGLYFSSKKINIINTTIMGLCFLAAALSKEEAVVFIFLVFFQNISKIKEHQKPFIKDQFSKPTIFTYITIFSCGLIYLALRSFFIDSPTTLTNYYLKNNFTHLAYIGESLWMYLKVSIWPFGYFGTIHTTTLFNFGTYDYIIGFLTLSFIPLIIFSALKFRSTSIILFCMWFISLLPVINIIPLTIGDNIIQDRFLTLPLVFFSIMLSRIEIHKPIIKDLTILNKLLPIGYLLWVIFSIITIKMTVPLWGTNLTLWSWALKENPNDVYVKYNYIASCLQYNRIKDAGVFFEKYPHETLIQINALHGVYQIETGHLDQGINELISVEKRMPDPYKKLLKMNVDISKAHALKGIDDIWFSQYLYTQLANAYIQKKDYYHSYQYAIIATFYSYYFPAAWAARSYAAYGIDNWADGNASFQRELDYNPPSLRIASIQARKYFLKNLCASKPNTTPLVCHSFQHEH